MPNRLIREGLLDSDRYWSVTIEARQLYLHLMLLADDLGLVSLAPAFVRRRCFDEKPSDEKVTRLITELSDADLVRVYQVDGGRFGFIPRFQQRLRVKRIRHPEPPAEILAGDDDALQKLHGIKGLTKKMSDTRQQPADICRLEPEPEPEPEPKPEREHASSPAHATAPTSAAGTAAGALAVAMRSAGVATVNPSHPTMLELVKAGVTPEQMTDLVIEFKRAGKSIEAPYLTSSMLRRLRDARRDVTAHQAARKQAQGGSLVDRYMRNWRGGTNDVIDVG